MITIVKTISINWDMTQRELHVVNTVFDAVNSDTALRKKICTEFGLDPVEVDEISAKLASEWSLNELHLSSY